MATGRKRRKPGASGSRARKKQKRLDAICDRPSTPVGSPSPYGAAAGEVPGEPEDPALLRRSARVRKAPIVLDSSPVPSPRKRRKGGRGNAQVGSGSVSRGLRKKRKNVILVDTKVKKEVMFEEADKPIAAPGFLEEEAADWCSRLRSRVRKGWCGAVSAAGKGKLPYRQSGELFLDDKDFSKPRKEVPNNLGSLELEPGRKERRRRKRRKRRKSKEKVEARVLLNDNKEKGSECEVSEEEENNGVMTIPEVENKAAAEASLEDEIKVIDEKTFTESKNRITYEEASSQDEDKTAARGGTPEDGSATVEKTLSEGNGNIIHKEASLEGLSKNAVKRDIPQQRRSKGEKGLSEGKTKITLEDGIAGRVDISGDGRITSEKAPLEAESIVKTAKDLLEYGDTVLPANFLQEDKDKTSTDKASLEKDNRDVAEKASADGRNQVADNSLLDGQCEHCVVLVAIGHTHEEQGVKCADENGGNSSHLIREKIAHIPHRSENGAIAQYVNVQMDELKARVSGGHDSLKQENPKQAHHVNALGRPRVREGRRCGLCGGGSDGKPPKKLVLESADSDNEPYNGSSSSEEPTYDVWDGFGDEPEWLGRLLGPIRDRFGMARVWVHQQCAVWSPEVYFAGLGRLKSIRAALYRGRALKCSRCGRPGATIGCRVDRCPKTYHLPCARAENCIFDHRKFLIACTDHRHIFQPQGDRYLLQIKKMKTRKMRTDFRKLSNEALRKDLEAEEKWLENCGEDEEFLKREGKRLHRDISRISPVYIGGSFSEKENTCLGWESVAGLQDVIQCMKEVVILPLLYPELFTSLGLTPPRGVLLHGYPGTGKTLVVRALIGECSRGDKQIAYFARKGADCLGKYVGDAERQLRLLFQVAERCQPSIIFFDEIDGLAPCRSKRQDQTHNSVVSTLLSLLDGLKSRGSVVVIGATNRPDAVDPALRRPGRFDREIYFPLPSVKDRSAILSLQTKNWPKPLSGPVLSWIANQTAGYAGADLQALCTQAAMIALKRNCPLHEILTLAEKGSSSMRQPSLPSFTVEERDWLAALASAPPPCSQREAGMAANGVVTAPLPAHLIPCLLQPLSYLLISFYFDERIWMPPTLFKASRSIKDVISSALQQMTMPITSWKSHLHHLIQKPDIAKEIEKHLASFGLLNSASPYVPFRTLGNNDDGHDKFDSQRFKFPGSGIHSFTTSNISVGLGKLSGFRVLISGTARSGQQHLATCLLHQFLGHIEIQKVNLATICQEGHGDIVRGITQILLKCLSLGQCVVYMPRLDLWAVDEMSQEVSEGSTGHKACQAPQSGGLENAAKLSSVVWNSFVEQLDSMSRSSSLIVLATCEMPNHHLPAEIREFFSTKLKGADSASSEHTIPRFSVEVDGNFKHYLVINSSIARISHDLVQQYIQMVHQRSHVSNVVHEELNVCCNTEISQERKSPIADNSEALEEICTVVHSERISSNHCTSLRDDHTLQPVNFNTRHNLISRVYNENDVPLPCHQDSLSRVPSNKITKGNSMYMIATLGYQILQYPQFAELCWATSKLKEGPFVDINGPWKAWPFNSCIIHANDSTDKATSPLNSSNVKDKENSGVVRGLIAVGLLAYKGAYTSVREVSLGVRKVLELLVRLISTKIQNGRDRYHFLRLLSQVAYLEDMVNSWAYTLQSFQVDGRSQMSASNKRAVMSGEVDENDSVKSCKLPANVTYVPNSHQKGCNGILEMLQRKSQQNCAERNAEHSNQLNCIVPEPVSLSEMLPSAPSLPDLLPVSADASTNYEETHRSENPVTCSFPSRGLEPPKNATGLPTIGSSSVANLHNVDQTISINFDSEDGGGNCNGLEAVNPCNSDRFISDEQVGDTESVCRKNGNRLCFSETLCLYDICADCLQSLRVLTEEILTSRWESNGHSPTVNDVHDIVTSCSLNLVAAVRKHFFSQSCTKFEDQCSREQHGAEMEGCVCRDFNDIKHKTMSDSIEKFEIMEFFPNECRWHLRDKNVSSTENKARNGSLTRPSFRFLFRDGTLLPSIPPEGVILHCNFEKLCIRSIIEMISLIKRS